MIVVVVANHSGRWVSIFLLLFILFLHNLADASEFGVGGLLTLDPDLPRYVPGEILVAYKPATSESAIQDMHNRHGGMFRYPSFSGRFERVKFDSRRSVEEIVAAYQREPSVDYAEPNYMAYAFFTPNDPLFANQWNFHSPHTNGVNKGGANLELAWNTATGQGVIVAVVDTGVAYEDFQNFRQAPDFAGVSFVPGHDFVDGDSHPNDENGHGTHVAGTIAQRTNNGFGTAGAAFGCSIMPVRVLNKDGAGTFADIVDGIDFAVENGADVINLSLGSDQPVETVERSLGEAHAKGVTLVCAAGNEFFSGSPTSFPAAYDAFCITVAAVRMDGQRAPYSNLGDYIDLAAPGGDLTVDQDGDGFADGVLQQTFMEDPQDFRFWFFQGTSMAAPHVSAAAAILISNGVTDPDDVAEALMFSARDMGPAGWDNGHGWGILDVNAALNYVSRPIHNVGILTIRTLREPMSGELSPVIVTIRNHSNQPENVEVSLKNAAGNKIVPSQSTRVELGSSFEFIFQWDTTGLPLGDYELNAEVSQLPGETDLTDNSRTITPTIVTEDSLTMYVEDIEIHTFEGTIAWSAIADVAIVSKGGRPVEGTLVFGTWSDPANNSTFSVTDTNGVARLSTGPIFGEQEEINLTVDNAVKQGWKFDPKDMTIEFPPWDVNRDGVINIIDIVLVGQDFGEIMVMPQESNPDVNGDGRIDIRDVIIVAQHFGEVSSTAPPAQDMWSIAPQHLSVLVRLYGIMENNPESSPGFLDTKQLIHNFILNARANKTEAFQNYPNPFNPETWIPYQLARDSKITVRIYDTNGKNIRTLSLGHKSAGIYMTKGRAAYWDGKNGAGERMASGIFFYTVQAGKFSATRKMVMQE